jgi:hypothetical protein
VTLRLLIRSGGQMDLNAQALGAIR